MSFTITNGSGFQLRLPNGWTVSVQFGAGNYGSNKDAGYTDARGQSFWEAGTAEIACLPTEGNGKWYQFSNEPSSRTDVRGYVNVPEFLEWLEVFKNLPSPEV